MTGTLRVMTGAGLIGLLLLAGGSAPVGAVQEPRVQEPRAQDPQAPPPVSQPPTFRTGVNLVRVDVVVTDEDGNQVSDLQPSDFEITDEGKRQAIEAFKLVSVDGQGDRDGAPPATSSDAVEDIESARDDVRVFAIFLDDYHVSSKWGRIAREQIARFVERELGPADLVAVMHPLTPLASVHLARNRTAVAAAIRDFDGQRGAAAESREYMVRPDQMSKIRRDVSFTALQALIMRLGSLKEGRKTLILLTEGYGSSPEVLGPVREIADLASRNNTAIYPVYAPIAGPTFAEGASVYAETIRTLAERSGGRTIIDQARTNSEYRDRVPIVGLPASKLSGVMRQIAVDSGAYYLLGYNPTDGSPDGRFHKIAVRVKRSGVQVRYRRGYLAWRVEDVERTTRAVEPPSPVQTALAFNAEPRGRIVRTWIGMTRGENQATRVTVAWEPVPPTPGDSTQAVDRPAHLTLKATGRDAVIYFDGRTADGSRGGGHSSFDVKPGPIQLQFSVENKDGAVLDSEVRSLVVLDLSVPRTVMGTPVLYRASTVAEWRMLKEKADVAPAAAREFSRTDRLLIRVPTYGDAGVPTAVSAKLLSRGGQEMTALPVTLSAAAGAPPGVWEIDLPVANLARGEYGIRLTASGSAGESSEVVGFRVIN